MNPEQPVPNIQSTPIQDSVPTPVSNVEPSIPSTEVPETPIEVPPSKPKSNVFIMIIVIIVSIALGAFGFWAYQKYFSKQSLVINGSVPSPSPMATTDPTEEWKQINKANWSFKVPDNWNYLECSDDLLFVGPKITKDSKENCAFDASPGTIQVSRTTDQNLFTIPANTDPSFDPYISNKSIINIDGKEATFQQETITDGQGAGTRLYVYIKHNEVMDKIILNEVDQKQTFDQILSTFKFVGQETLNTNLKTFTTQDGKVSFQYPANWSVTQKTTSEGWGKPITTATFTNKSIKLSVDVANFFMNEWMKEISSKDVTLSGITFHEKKFQGQYVEDAHPDPDNINNFEIWLQPAIIDKEPNNYQYGINLQYRLVDQKDAENSFDQILSTLKFKL